MPKLEPANRYSAGSHDFATTAAKRGVDRPKTNAVIRDSREPLTGDFHEHTTSALTQKHNHRHAA
jgi:hypothetical protein